MLLNMIPILSGFLVASICLIFFQLVSAITAELRTLEFILFSLVLILFEVFLKKIKKERKIYEDMLVCSLSITGFGVFAFLLIRNPVEIAHNPAVSFLSLTIFIYSIFKILQWSAEKQIYSKQADQSRILCWVIFFFTGILLGVLVRIPIVVNYGNIGVILVSACVLILVLVFYALFSNESNAGIGNFNVSAGEGVLTRNRYFFSICVTSILTILMVQLGFWYLKQVSENNYFSSVLHLAGFLISFLIGGIVSNVVVPEKFRGRPAVLNAGIFIIVSTCLVSFLSFKNIYKMGYIAWLFCGDSTYAQIWFDILISLLCFGPFAFSLGFLVSVFIWAFQPHAGQRSYFPIWCMFTFLGSVSFLQDFLIPLIGVSWVAAALPQMFFLLIPNVTRTWVALAITITGFSLIFLIELSPVKFDESASTQESTQIIIEDKCGLIEISEGRRTPSFRWNSQILFTGENQIKKNLFSSLWEPNCDSYLYFGFNPEFGQALRYQNRNVGRGIKGKHVVPVNFMHHSLVNTFPKSEYASDPVYSLGKHKEALGQNLIDCLIGKKDKYDLIIIDSLHPSLPEYGVYLADEIFQMLRSNLSDDGWLFLWWPINQVSYQSTRILSHTFLKNMENVQVVVLDEETDNPLIGFIGGNEDSVSPSLNQINNRLQEWNKSDDIREEFEVFDIFYGFLGGENWLENRIGEKEIGNLLDQTILASIPYSPRPRRSQLLEWISKGLDDSWSTNRNQSNPMVVTDIELSTKWLKCRKAFKSYLDGLKGMNSNDYLSASEKFMESLNHDPSFEKSQKYLYLILSKVGEKEKMLQLEILNFLRNLRVNRI